MTPNESPTGPEVRLLLVEDVETSAEIAKQALDSAGTPHFVYDHVTTLADARKALRKESYDVVLLDLGLPDSDGLVTLDAVRTTVPDTAIVALTSLEFDDMALAALRRGADDYLYKGEFDRNVLVRSVRHSIERRRMLTELDRSRQRRNLARAMRALTRFSALRSTPIREGGEEAPHEEVSLREMDPEMFAKLATRYGDIAEDTMRAHAAPDGPTEPDAAPLWQIAQELAARRVDAADIVDLHTVALRQRMGGLGADEAEAIVAAGRLLVLDLMGLVATDYRRHAITS